MICLISFLLPRSTCLQEIYSTANAFAALTPDGSIKAWGDSSSGGANAPAGSGYTKIYSNTFAFAALTHDYAFAPPESESPHVLIDPSALRAAKAYVFE
jgi:hypothetical protein